VSPYADALSNDEYRKIEEEERHEMFLRSIEAINNPFIHN
jgi:hypothetical protein